jgi:hypothetical protein
MRDNVGIDRQFIEETLNKGNIEAAGSSFGKTLSSRFLFRARARGWRA